MEAMRQFEEEVEKLRTFAGIDPEIYPIKCIKWETRYKLESEIRAPLLRETEGFIGYVIASTHDQGNIFILCKNDGRCYQIKGFILTQTGSDEFSCDPIGSPQKDLKSVLSAASPIFAKLINSSSDQIKNIDKKFFILSSGGLKNLILNQYHEDEFKFIFGNREVKMNNIFAEFISPYVSQIHHSDPTIDCIRFPMQLFDHRYVTDEAIQLLDLISKGNAIKINETQCKQLQIISVLLKNDEMFAKLDSLFPTERYDNKLTEELKFISFLEENSELS